MRTGWNGGDGLVEFEFVQNSYIVEVEHINWV